MKRRLGALEFHMSNLWEVVKQNPCDCTFCVTLPSITHSRTNGDMDFVYTLKRIDQLEAHLAIMTDLDCKCKSCTHNRRGVQPVCCCPQSPCLKPDATCATPKGGCRNEQGECLCVNSASKLV